jgi:glycosyltransferase involved in cell wall biosynthesis
MIYVVTFSKEVTQGGGKAVLDYLWSINCAGKGDKLTLLSLTGETNLSDIAKSHGFEVICLNLYFSPNFFKNLLQFLKLCIRDGVVFISNDERSTFFCSIGYILGCIHVVVLHRVLTDIPLWKNPLKNALFIKIENLVLRKFTTRVVAISEHMKNNIIKRNVNEKKIDIVYHKFNKDFKFIKQFAVIDFDRIKLLYVGRLQEEKGIQNLVKMFGTLPLQRNMSLTVIGDGSLRGELNNESNHNVSYLGHLKITDEIYQSYDVVVIPSKTEAFCFVALEAIQNGRFVIYRDIPALKEILVQYPYSVSFRNDEELKQLFFKLSKSINIFDREFDSGVTLNSLSRYSNKQQSINWNKVLNQC